MQDIPGRTILSIGSVVQGRYIIKNLLGLGGFGAVYLVSDEQVPDKLFALKEVIDPSQRERERFTFECDVLKRLTHPSLPRVHAVFEDERNNRAYLLMDYIEGPNLERLRQQQPRRRFTLLQVITIMAPIVDVIAYLHNQHPPIIHRDIKPANIIIPASGGDAVLVDFGIAKEYDPNATTTAMRHCSPGYSAPEQYTRGTDARTDIYALGATFYTLLTGILPTDALQRLTLLGSRGTDPLKPITQLAPALPPTVEKAIGCALAINSDDRFPTLEEFWQAVSAHPSGVVASASVAGSIEPSIRQPAVTSFMHLPAVATPRVTVHRQRRMQATQKRYAIALSLVAVAMLALLASFALRASFWSTNDSLALSTPTAPSQIGCDGTITSTTASPGSVCQMLITPTGEPTVTPAKAPPTVTPPTSEPGVTTPTTEPSVTPPTPEPGVIMPTTGPNVIRPLPTTVPDQSSPTLTSAAVITSPPSGLMMIAEKSTNGSNHGNDKKHRRGKKHESKIRRRDNIHRVRRTHCASCK
ncbi:MAG TPA: protein kinase [Ktedonobacteraceae bacterium]|nr:protein kinase [Ktedonobacteraceae bacterium]